MPYFIQILRLSGFLDKKSAVANVIPMRMLYLFFSTPVQVNKTQPLEKVRCHCLLWGILNCLHKPEWGTVITMSTYLREKNYGEYYVKKMMRMWFYQLFD